MYNIINVIVNQGYTQKLGQINIIQNVKHQMNKINQFLKPHYTRDSLKIRKVRFVRLTKTLIIPY